MTVRQTALKLTVVALLALLFAVAVPDAHAHDSGRDSVDDCEIRWEESTKYDTERKAAQILWESLKGSDNCVDIEPDTWNTITDLEWRDTYNPSGFPGLWQQYFGADRITLNSYYLDSWPSCRRKNTAMHELGHAHGFKNHTLNDNIMYRANKDWCVLGNHDRDDYEGLWGDS